MDLHRLEVFCKVIDLKSFTKAADAALLSQPTVSEHIRSLEETLDVRLIDRLGREVLPTQAGKILYDYARKILRLRREATEAIASHSGRLVGHLWAGASTIPGTYLLPELLGLFKQRCPEVLVTVNIAGSRQVADKVIQGDCEFGITGAKWNETSLQWEPLCSDELVLTVGRDHPWARRDQIELAELTTLPFIDRERESGTRKAMNEILAAAGMDPARLQIIAEMGSTEAVRQGVKAGIGVAIISRRAVREDFDCGLLTEVAIRDVRFTRPFYLVQRKNRSLSPIAALFLDFLRQNV
ncbi:selenium metabolism-associated LysR family transcriptional regulator [Desulfurivibrio sp. C05AmB]|uniref:selenium metabolism-associated LysR family transcriptional regulator n=1 Tax=Desulfurivibrio sp. C05AmB TaxID=3374371 RepID=UPI00376EFE15